MLLPRLPQPQGLLGSKLTAKHSWALTGEEKQPLRHQQQRDGPMSEELARPSSCFGGRILRALCPSPQFLQLLSKALLRFTGLMRCDFLSGMSPAHGLHPTSVCSRPRLLGRPAWLDMCGLHTSSPVASCWPQSTWDKEERRLRKGPGPTAWGHAARGHPERRVF